MNHDMKVSKKIIETCFLLKIKKGCTSKVTSSRLVHSERFTACVFKSLIFNIKQVCRSRKIQLHLDLLQHLQKKIFRAQFSYLKERKLLKPVESYSSKTHSFEFRKEKLHSKLSSVSQISAHGLFCGCVGNSWEMAEEEAQRRRLGCEKGCKLGSPWESEVCHRLHFLY